MANENRKKNIVKYFLKSKGDTRMETKYFYCYDQRFAKYLKSKGFDYITLAKSRHTDKLFSLWEITDKFQEVLNAYECVA